MTFAAFCKHFEIQLHGQSDEFKQVQFEVFTQSKTRHDDTNENKNVEIPASKTSTEDLNMPSDTTKDAFMYPPQDSLTQSRERALQVVFDMACQRAAAKSQHVVVLAGKKK